MALQSSGPIALSDVNAELGRSPSAPISLGEAAVRDLFGIASGPIRLSDGYGTSAIPPTLVYGQQAFTSPGTYSWIAPADVYQISAVCIGGGAGGGGGYAGGGGAGGLGWKNAIPVTPGQSYTVVVGAGGAGGAKGATIWEAGAGAHGGDSYFISTSTVCGRAGQGGTSATTGGSYIGDGGGAGGSSGTYGSGYHYPGGGAGGYLGTGGTWASSKLETYVAGSGSGRMGFRSTSHSPSGGGGGVGLRGLGADATVPGQGGSGGGDAPAPATNYAATGGAGGAPGGGGGAGYHLGGQGAPGAVRLIWGDGRAFPSLNTGDM